MGQNIRRIDYLRSRIGFLEAKKEQLRRLVTSNTGKDTLEAWSGQLDSTLQTLRKHSAELADLEREENSDWMH